MSVHVPAGTLRFEVLKFLRYLGETGATDEQIAQALDLKADTARPRRRELTLDGLVVDSGRRRKTSSGNMGTG